jgi:hypothetical protein
MDSNTFQPACDDTYWHNTCRELTTPGTLVRRFSFLYGIDKGAEPLGFGFQPPTATSCETSVYATSYLTHHPLSLKLAPATLSESALLFTSPTNHRITFFLASCPNEYCARKRGQPSRNERPSSRRTECVRGSPKARAFSSRQQGTGRKQPTNSNRPWFSLE